MIGRKDLKESYALAEKTRLKLWEMIEDTAVEEPMSPDNVMIEVREKGDIIKITVSDILPRNAELNNNLLKLHWLGIMHKALKDINKQYEKVLCIIKVYNTVSKWDVDNRVYKFIIDGLRYNKLIKDDDVSHLSFMVMGEKSSNPRTEIYILEHPREIFGIKNW